MRKNKGRREGKTSATRTEIVPGAWRVRIEISSKVMHARRIFSMSFSKSRLRGLGPSQAGHSTV